MTDQLDLFADIVPAKPKRGRKRKVTKPASVVAFPMERDQSAVRRTAEMMAKIPDEERDPFWRGYARDLFEKRMAAGVPRADARADVIAFTAAVRRLTAFLDSDPQRIMSRR